MSGIDARPNDHVVRSQFVASLDDQSRDWELVLRESHHRMKNTLTILGASVRRDFTRTGTRDVSLAADRLERRIVAFGRLYQLLSDNDDHTAIPVAAFFENLCGAISEAVLEPAGIRCEAAIESGTLPASQCHRLALMLTELVTNAAKHAFPNRNDALIRIDLANRDGQRDRRDRAASGHRQPDSRRTRTQHSRPAAGRGGRRRHTRNHRDADHSCLKLVLDPTQGVRHGHYRNRPRRRGQAFQ
jgi:two-component sensor histidine kinase